MGEVTRILGRLERGDSTAAVELLPLMYDELKGLAKKMMARERPGHTLQATALLHEAYLRLLGSDSGRSWHTKGHFFNAAAEAMRRILIDHARRKRTFKHGGNLKRLEFEIDLEVAGRSTGVSSEDLIALDEALRLLEREDPLKARLVSLRFFGGLTIEQAAESLGISRVTANRSWNYSRAWLRARMRGEEAD